MAEILFHSPHPGPLPKGARELPFPRRCLEAALGRVKRTIWASEAEYAAIRAYLEPPREAAGSAPAGPAGQRLEAVLQAELAAVRVAQGVALARHREQQRARRERWREPEAARPERRP